MDLEIKVLDLVFRRTSAERVLRRLESEEGGALELDKDAFLDVADVSLGNYSKDEQSLLFDYHIGQHIQELAEEFGLPRSPFLLLLDLAQKTFVRKGNGLACRIHRVLPWRDAYLLLGQDLFVCAYLALLDGLESFERRDFAWPAILPTDLVELGRLLERGLAENHYHLNGSAQSFALSWCGLMNRPEAAAQFSARFDRLLQPSYVRRPKECLLDSRDRTRYAAACRCRLFQRLHSSPLGDRRISASFQSDFVPFAAIWDEIRVLQARYGTMLPQPPGSPPECFDYALVPAVCRPDSPYRILAGERYFLYRCFQACWKNDLSPREQDMFYLYLLLKHQFRSEMIQVNQQTGFLNFADYQDRKDALLIRPAYQLEAYRTGLNAPLQEGHVTSLEARICPRQDTKATLDVIQEIDSAYSFAQPGGRFAPPDAGEARELPYFFVLHFPKRPDTPVLPFTLTCRHEKYREEVKTCALALADALDRYPYLRARVRGIDGCSNEIGCRPEVFAPAFRFLRSFRGFTRRPPQWELPQQAPPPRLAVTYHVGEDFLDIPNALRAVDEALTFFQCQRGDRMGHALALGADVGEYYAGKSFRVTLSKQERLDDLVWLLYRGRELGVSIPPELESDLREQAGVLLREIYGPAIHDNGWSVSLQEYHCAMQLRGDDPLLYRTMRCQEPAMFGRPYDAHRLDSSPKLRLYRKDPMLAGMYYYYHYGEEEKQRGRRLLQVDVSRNYMDYTVRCQNALLALLARQGIVVECNPSSNVLIGTFRSYESHPIFRFNNDGFEPDPRRRMDCPQVQVCVNTDDLGVFDTSLEFEYALLYHALDRQEQEEKRWHSCDTMRYLENLRVMGQQAVFPAAHA